MSVMVPLGVVYEIRWVFSQKKLSFCQLLYGRKCQRRGQALGQKKDKILSTPTNLFFALELLIDSKFQVSHFSGLEKILITISERGYLVRTLASRPEVPGLNPIAAPKPCEVYPSTCGLLTFKKSETVLWSISKHYYYNY